jgi:hypothetical protein
MKRVLAVVLLAVAWTGAEAQQSRDRLDLVNGVRFGSTLEEAKNVLGPKAKVGDVLRGGDAPRNVPNLSIGDTPMFGIPFDLSYDFASGGRLTSVVALPSGTGVVAIKETKSCHGVGDRVLQGIVDMYGQPTKNVLDQKGLGQGPFRHVQFDFKDGSGIRLEYGLEKMISVYCAVSLYYWSSRGKSDWKHAPL